MLRNIRRFFQDIRDGWINGWDRFLGQLRGRFSPTAASGLPGLTSHEVKKSRQSRGAKRCHRPGIERIETRESPGSLLLLANAWIFPELAAQVADIEDPHQVVIPKSTPSVAVVNEAEWFCGGGNDTAESGTVSAPAKPASEAFAVAAKCSSEWGMSFQFGAEIWEDLFADPFGKSADQYAGLGGSHIPQMEFPPSDAGFTPASAGAVNEGSLGGTSGSGSGANASTDPVMPSTNSGGPEKTSSESATSTRPSVDPITTTTPTSSHQPTNTHPPGTTTTTNRSPTSSHQPTNTHPPGGAAVERPAVTQLGAVHRLSSVGGGQLYVLGSVDATEATPGAAMVVEFLRNGQTSQVIGSVALTRSTSAAIPLRVVIQGSLSASDTLVAKTTSPQGQSFSNAIRLSPWVDTDGDAISDGIENLGLSGGDANRDGVRDALQPSVATLPAAGNGQLVTINARGHALRNVGTMAVPESDSAYKRLPYGLFGYQVMDVSLGGIAAVDLTFSGGKRPNAYYKQNADGKLELFDYDGETGALFGADTVTLYLKDGGRGDLDGVANGTILDPGGPAAGLVLLTSGQPDPFTGWAVSETGGRNGLQGSVLFENRSFVLREGNSFLVELRHEVTIPDTPTVLEFDYIGEFDTTDPDSIKDTFEVSFVSANGTSLVPTFAYQRDAFFNLTEGESQALGMDTEHFPLPENQGTTVAGTVQVDISQLTPGSTGIVILRLVNNDSDTGTVFRMLCYEAPLALNDSYSVDEDTMLYVDAMTGVLANDSDTDSPLLNAALVIAPEHGTLTLNSDGLFVYVAEANYHGPDSFVYVANDGRQDSNLATVSLTVNSVNDPPVAESEYYQTMEDQLLVVSAANGVLANDSDLDSLAVTAVLETTTSYGTLTLNADGSFVYMPGADYAGFDYFMYRASDGTDTSASTLVYLTINPLDDPPVADPDAYAVTEDNTLVVDWTNGVLAGDYDPEGNYLTAIMVSGPQHGMLDLLWDGSFTYTPNVDFHGTDTFTYMASDGISQSPVKPVTITVTPVNDAPVANDDAYSIPEDNVLTVTMPGMLRNDTDVDGDALTAVVVVGPSHGTLTANPNGSFTYSPDTNYIGTDTFTYKANDGALESNIVPVTITVTAVNDAPLAAADEYTTNEDTALLVGVALGLLVNDSDVDGDALTVAVTSLPSHGAITINPDGSFEYVPHANYAGDDTFTYQTWDGQANSNEVTVTIHVTAINDPPVANNDSFATPEDTPLTINAAAGLLANDTDVESATLTVAVVTQPAHGILALSSNGSFTYTPDANFNGTDTFTYQANDGSFASNVATVTITIGAVNDPPVAANDSYSATEDAPLTIDAASGMLINDTDIDSPTLTAAIVTQPVHGTVNLNSEGSFTYTPAANYHGTDSFQYQAFDGELYSNIATVNIMVEAVNDAPLATNDSYAIAEDGTMNVAAGGVLANDADVDGDTLSAILVTSPGHGTLSFNSDGSFTYTPHANFHGADTFTYKANDGWLDSNVATVSLTVTPVNDAPVANNDSYSVSEDAVLTVNLPGSLGNDTDVDGDALTAVLVADPSHGTLELHPDGSFTYTPAANYHGSDTFTYQANDTVANSNVATVTITVEPVNDAPIATADQYSTYRNTAINVSASGVLGNDTDIEGDGLSAVLVAGPSHGTLILQSNGAFVYAPATNYVGTDTFTYQANDGSQPSNLVTVTLTILDRQRAPVAVNDSYTISSTPLTVSAASGVLSNDTDADNDVLTAVLVEGPQYGSLTLNANGAFVYTPGINFTGSDSFTYRANDGRDVSDIATVTLSVHASKQAPVANSDNYQTMEGGVLSVPAAGVLANDTDADNDPLTAHLIAAPGHGTVTFNANGSFVYTPALGFRGVDTFTYRANDGLLSSAVTTVTITVAARPAVKFYVTDQSAHSTFFYSSTGAYAGRFGHNSPNERTRGIAANAAGTRLWTVDDHSTVNVYTAAGSYLGSWHADGVNKKDNIAQVEDIATDGTHVWLVDAAKDKIYYFEGKASETGSAEGPHFPSIRATSAHNLHSTNQNPTGMVARGEYLWVTDRVNTNTVKVFVYKFTVAAGLAYQGVWLLDGRNDDPSGITLNPNGGTDMWVADRLDDVVYQYTNSTGRRSGSQNAEPTPWALHGDNAHPEGIADPPPAANPNTWVASNSGLWTDPANWSTGQVPDADDDVIIDIPGGDYTITMPWGFYSIHSLYATKNLVLEGGSLEIAALSEVAGTLTLPQGMNLAGAGNLEITGTLNWTGGQMTGNGTTTIKTGGTLNASGDANKALGRALVNEGTVIWTDRGGLGLQSGGAITNQVGGLFEARSDAPLSTIDYGANVSFTNAGTFRKTVGGGSTDIAIAFNNTGSVEVQSGRLGLQGGGTSSGSFSVAAGTWLIFGGNMMMYGATTTLQAGSSVSGAGTVKFNSSDGLGYGGADVYGSYTITGTTVIEYGTVNFYQDVTLAQATLDGGSLGGSGNVTLAGTMNWLGGDMIDSGTFTVATNGTLNSEGSGAKKIARPFVNAGTVNLRGSSSLEGQTGASFLNQSSGQFLLHGDLGITNMMSYGSGVTFTNAGALRKQSGSGESSMVLNFANSGIVEVLAGTLQFYDAVTNAGTVTLQNGTTLAINPMMSMGRGYTQTAGATQLVGATMNVSSGMMGGAGVDIQGGLLKGSGTITADVSNAGTVEIGNPTGVLNLAGNYTQTSTGTLKVSVAGSGAAGVGYDQLNVEGAVTLAGNLDVTATGSTLIGDHLLIIANDDTDGITGTFDGVTEGALLAVNGMPLRVSYVGDSGNDFNLMHEGPMLSIENVRQAEGNSGPTAFVFTVTLVGAHSDPVTVNYRTVAATATAGEDYTPVSGMLTFAANETAQTIVVDALGDTTAERNERFLVVLEQPVNAGLEVATGRGTITNDDGVLQSFDSKGTNFWLAFPANGATAYPQSLELTLFITGDTDTTGTVTIPGLGFSQAFAIQADQITTVIIPSSADLALSTDEITNKGIHVESVDEISVYGLSRMTRSTDGYLGFPVDVLGDDYIVLGWRNGNPLGFNFATEFVIVGVENGTEVTITPSVEVGSHPAGVPYVITLNQGQTYQLRRYDVGFDLSGTVLQSTAPIAVFGGHEGANIPNDKVRADFIGEQLPPTSTWGKRFLTVPLASRQNGDTFRFLASEDDTVVRVDGVVVATLDRGQYHERILTTPSEIESNKSILVAQYSNSIEYDYGEFFDENNSEPGDPFMMLISPQEQFMADYTVSTPASGFIENYINIVAPNSAVGTITLDNELIPANLFQPIGSSGFSCAQIPVNLGSHHFEGSLPFGIYVYGFDFRDSYGYPGGMSLAPVATINHLSLSPATETALVNTTKTMTATVTNAQNQPLAGVRVDFVVSGANTAQGFAFTNAQGQATFTYTGTQQGNDTIIATSGSLTATAQKIWNQVGPSIIIKTPSKNSPLPNGSRQLIAGLATPGMSNAPIAYVTINGVGVDSLDAAGNFFALVDILPSSHTYTFVATDILGQTATTTLTLVGVQTPSRGIDFSTLSDVSTIAGEYGRTSWNEKTDMLYAELAIRNIGQYRIGRPLLVGIKNISDPRVRVRDFDGFTLDGIPYYDFSDLVGGDTLDPNEETGRRSLAFANPNQAQFTYELVLLGQLNRAPRFTTVPKVAVMAGTPFLYAFAATDPDGNPLTYALPVRPENMTIPSGTTSLSWTPMSTDIGIHSISLRVDDGFGGSAIQQFELTVYASPPNRPPRFTTAPVVVAYVNTDYVYAANADDPDGQALTYAVNEVAGLQVVSSGANAGRLSWRPNADQVGDHPIALTADDGQGGQAVQFFTLQVRPEPGNRPPEILSSPLTTALAGQTYGYPVVAADPDNDTLQYSLDAPSLARGLAIDSATGLLTWNAPPNTSDQFDVIVRVDDGRGWHATQTYQLTLVNTAPVTLAGTVFQDTDSDGSFEAGEPGQPGWQVFLDANNNRRLDGGEAHLLTDSSGNYNFTSVTPGAYNVAIIVQDSWVLASPATLSYRGNATGSQVVADLNFGLVARGIANHRPTFISSPPTAAVPGQRLRHDPIVTDEDNDVLTFRLAVKPLGMAIDTATGTIVWTPTEDQLGSHYVTIAVDDGQGGTAVQSFVLQVGSDNDLPTIISMPRGPAGNGLLWQYDVEASDTNGDVLSYSLDAASLGRGMSIDPNTGFVQWTPTVDGFYRVQIVVDDGRGGRASQTFTLEVTGNGPPAIASRPAAPALVGQTYTYLIDAPDPNGDAVQLRLDAASLARGMTLDNPIHHGATLTWTPNQLGDFGVVITVDDGHGGTASQSFTLPVRAPVVPSLPPEITSRPKGPAYVNQAWTYVVTATDADNDPATLAYALLSPTGDPEVSFDENTRTLTWTPTSATSKSFTVRVTDAANSFSEQSFTLTAQVSRDGQLPRITSVPTGPATVGQEYVYQVVAHDPNGDTLTYTLDQPLAGVTLNASTGRLVFQPTSATPITLAIRVADQIDGYVMQTFTLDVVNPPNHTPRITSAPVGPAISGQPWTYQVAATDPDGDAVTFALQHSAMESVTFVNGLLTWTPSWQGSTLAATITASDGRGGTVTQQFSLSAREAPVGNPPNPVPVFASQPQGPAFQGQQWTYFAQAIDPDGQTVTYSLDPASIGRGLIIDPATGRLDWTPNTTGTFRVEVTANDGSGGEVTQHFYLTVDRTNVAPEITSRPAGTAIVGTPWTYTLTATDLDDMPASLTYELLSPESSASISFNPATRTLTWTPSAVTTQEFVLRVRDPQNGFAEQRFTMASTLTAPANLSPVIRSVPANPTQLGDLYTYAVDAYDPNDDALNYELTTAPPGMAVDAQGWITWRPTATGTYNVTLAVRDGINSPVTQSYTLVVQAPVALNEPPPITSQPTGPAMRNKAWQYAAQATDPDGDTLVWSLDTSLVPSAAVGNLSINATSGLVTWTPTVEGSFDLLVIANDQHGGIISQRFTLPVLRNAPPVITSTPVTSVEVGQTYTYDLNADDPNPGDNVTYALDQASLDRGLTIGATTGIITWTTPALGVYTVIATATDQDGAQDTQTFTLRVADPNSNHTPLILSNIRSQLQVGQLLTHQVEAADEDGDTLTYQLLTPPAGMSIDSAGLISWTPAANQVGSHTFQVQVADGRQNGTTANSFTITVGNEAVNHPPEFTTAPRTNLVVGYAYAYAAQATDLDGDSLVFSLVNPPSGMTIDPQTGLIRWTPRASDVGQHTLQVRVADSQGAAVEQIATLTVRETNRPPVVTSNPPTTAVKDRLYTYTVRAADPDGDALRFSLGAGTTAIGHGPLSINATTGVLTWTPDVSEPATYRLQINIVDEQGLGIAQIFDVAVALTAPNDPPRFDTSPTSLTAAANTPFRYDANAADPNGDTVTYRLVTPATPPANLTFDGDTGLLTFTPTTDQVDNLVDVVIEASDGTLTAKQSFQLRVTPPNVAPAIIAIPDATVTADAAFRFDVRATDANNDTLTYALDTAAKNRGLAIDSHGRITWTPTAAQISATGYAVVVTVSDGQLTVTDTFKIVVTADTSAPTVSIVMGSNQARVGDEVVLKVHAVDNVRVESRTLTLTSVTFGGFTTTLNQALSLDAQGQARLTITAALIGTLRFDASATDTANNTGTAEPANLLVPNPADQQAPTAALLGEDHLVVTQPLDIRGIVNDDYPADVRWTLTLVAEDNGTTRTLAAGVGAVDRAVLATLDPTHLRNGAYTLTLTATDSGGAVSADAIAVEIEGNLKLGNFTMTFVDLQLPVAGLPITVSRKYDTLDADKQGDFGHGWSLELSNTKVKVVQDPDRVPDLSGYKPFRDGDRVVITLPDGTKEGFTFYGRPGQQFFGVVFDWLPTFIPDSGVKSTLIVDEVSLRKVGDDYLDLESGHLYNPADPAFGGAYLLRLRNGNELLINARTGELDTITDRNGNTLTFRADGITSASGRGVQFERDWAGRIAAVIDPRGKRLDYTYDAQGDLIAVKNRAGATTQFTYRADLPHYLDAIIDPLGRRAAKNEYDSQGRLASITDAAGKTTRTSHDVNGQTQTITDALGNTTTQTLDARGNIIREVDPTGVITKRTFDAKDRLLTETQVIGLDDAASGETNDLTTTHRYDADGNRTETIDPRGNSTLTTYGLHGEPLTTTDELGNTTRNLFDDQGLLRSITDSLGNTTSLTYDAKGNLQTATNAAGVELVRNDYNAFGEVISVTPAAGRATTIEYTINGDQAGSWYFDETGPTPVQVLNVTYYDDERRVRGTTRAVLPQGQFITQNVSEATIPAQYVQSSTSTTYNEVGQVASTTDENGLVTENTYNLLGQLIQTRQQRRTAAGHIEWLVTRTVFDAAGRAVVQTQPYREGTTEPIEGTRTTYDGAQRIRKTERLRGVVIDLTGPAAALQSVVAVAGTVVSFSTTDYDSAGRVEKSVDEFGLETRTTYNAKGETVETRRQALDENGQTVWLVNRTVYDSFGRVVLQSDSYLEGSSNPLGGNQTSYDDQGRAAQTSRRAGIQIDLAGGETSIGSLGTQQYVTRTLFDAQGRVAATIAADGQRTRHEYDSLGRPAATIGQPLPAADVGLTGFPAGTTVALRTETVFNALGQTWKQRTNIRQLTLLDGTVQIDDSQVQTTTFAYDEFGRQTKTIYPDGSFIAATYDRLGRKESETNQLGQTRNFQYDSSGRLAAVLLPAVLNPATNQSERPKYEYAYDAHGHQTLLRDPLGRETRFTFDDQGHQLTRTLPLGFGLDGIQSTADDAAVSAGDWTEHFAYDDRGRQTLHVSFEGVVTQSVHDERTGRLTEQRFFDNLASYNNGAGTPAEVWTYKHDTFGREVEVRQTRGSILRTVTKAYDGEGRLMRIASPEGTVNYEYDDLGRQTRTYTGTAASPVSDYRYSYDSLGRLATVEVRERNGVTLATPETTSYQYDLVGNLDLQRHANGTIVDYVYDALNRLDTLTIYASDATPNDLTDNPKIADFDYTVRADGKRTAVTERIWKDGPSQSPLVHQFGWTYDDIGRLTQETFDSSDNAFDYTTNYKFDLAGNRLEKKVDQGSNNSIDQFFASVFDANDRLRTESFDNGMDGIIDQITTYSWGVNNFGTQQTSKTVHDQASNLDTSRVTYGYDLQGRMEVVTTESLTTGSVTRRDKVTFNYDHTGIRVSALQETDAAADGSFETRALTEYLIDPQNFTGYQQVLSETVKNADTGEIQKVIDYTLGLDLITQTTTDYVAGVPQSPVTLTFGYDGHGSTRVLTDLAGAIATIAGLQQIFAYDAYGNAIGFNPVLAATSYLYSGEQWDQRIAMQYLRARFYDPATGRFNRLDPFFGNSQDPQSFHKYLFVHNDPINRIDPTGLEGFLAGIGVRLAAFGNLIARIGLTSLSGIWRGSGFVFRTLFLYSARAQTFWFNNALKIEYWLTVGLFGFFAAPAALEWAEDAVNRIASNLQPITPGGPSSSNVGHFVQDLVGASATEYETFDHLVPEGHGRSGIVSLSSRYANPSVSDDVFMQRVLNRLQEKGRPLTTERQFTPVPGSSSPILQPHQVGSRSVIVVIPETRAHILSNPRFLEMVRSLQQNLRRVRLMVVPLRGWRP